MYQSVVQVVSDCLDGSEVQRPAAKYGPLRTIFRGVIGWQTKLIEQGPGGYLQLQHAMPYHRKRSMRTVRGQSV